MLALAAAAAAAALAVAGRGPRAVRLAVATILATMALVHSGEVLEWSGVERWAATTELLAVVIPALGIAAFVTGGLEILLARARAREQQLQVVFARATTPLALLDRDGSTLVASPDWSRWAHAEVEAAIAHLHRACLREGTPQRASGPLPVRCEDAVEWVEVVLAPWSDGTGPAGALAVLTRVTDVVEQATQEQARLEELRHHDRLELVGLVAAGVAHDLRNMLMAIDWHASTVADPTTSREALDDVADDLQRRARLTNDLLSSLTGLARRTPEAPGPLDLARLVDDSRRLLQRSVPPRVRLAIEGTERALPLVGSRVKLHQVLINLLVNASDATEGRGRVRLEVGACDRDGVPAIYAEVADDGCGMSAAQQARIFEPLFTTKGAAGTGLGLAIVRSIVDEAGGAITVESAPDAGTKVRVTFPRHGPVPARAAGSPAAEATTPG